MGDCNFNKRQCVRALNGLGFYLSNDRRGDHDKYHFPPEYVIPKDVFFRIRLRECVAENDLRLPHPPMRA